MGNVSLWHKGKAERDVWSLHEARREVREVAHGGGSWKGREKRPWEGGVAGTRRDR